MTRTPEPAAAIFPNIGALGGAAHLEAIVGALLTLVLITAVMTVIVSAAMWGVAAAHGNQHAATRAQTGLWVAVGTAVLAGAGTTWMNFLLHLGATL